MLFTENPRETPPMKTRSVWEDLMTGLRLLACGAGWLLAYAGATTFAAALFCLLLFPTHGIELAGLFQLGGRFLVPAWLLLRFSDGIFPFGRRLFRG
jgi:hypothetical protein